MQRKNRRFHGTSVEATRVDFVAFLGDSNKWFADLLYGFRIGYIQKGRFITEILIRERMEVRASILKSYIPVHCKDEMADDEDGNLFIPSRKLILQLVDVFVEYTKNEELSKSELYGHSVDFSFQVFGLGIFRVNFSHGDEGCSLSLRYLPYDVPSISEVGYPKMYQEFLASITQNITVTTPPVVSDDFYISINGYKKALEFDKAKMEELPLSVPRAGGGLVLHIGATSSGKTTSMGAEISQLANNTSGLILTYEDPVEFIHISTNAPVLSFEIGRDLTESDGFTLAEVIQRHALRRNPSVIMFGELRTKEQMRLAVDLSNRGHWVFASMHGNDVYEGISVLAAIYKDEPYLLANALKAAIAHRLTTSMVTGQIVPLFEIYIPDRVGKQHLHDGKPAAIRAQMTKNNPTIYCSFNASLEHMVELKRVDFSEKESIRLAVIGMTDNEREEQIQRGKEGNA